MPAQAGEQLVEHMVQMPLCPNAFLDAELTAGRLIRLLPLHQGRLQKSNSEQATRPNVPAWAPMVVFYFAMAMGIAFNVVTFARHAHDSAIGQQGDLSPSMIVRPGAGPTYQPNALSQKPEASATKG